MKIGILGDLHLTDRSSKSRRDNAYKALIDKREQTTEIFKRLRVHLIVQPGDFFDSHRVSDYVKQEVISWLRNNSFRALCVFGQHDLRYHSKATDNTPLKVLDSAGVVTLLKAGEIYTEDNIEFTGLSWFDEFDSLPQMSADKIRVLVLHHMIVDQKIWEGQQNFTYSKLFLKRMNQFDLIVSGDNHKLFIERSADRYLINAGSFLRTRIDQEDHRPTVFVYDTETKTIDQFHLDVKPFREVIKIEEVERQREEDKNIKAFVDALNTDTKLVGINYKRNIATFLEQNNDKIDSDTKEFIDNVLMNLEEGNGLSDDQE